MSITLKSPVGLGLLLPLIVVELAGQQAPMSVYQPEPSLMRTAAQQEPPPGLSIASSIDPYVLPELSPEERQPDPLSVVPQVGVRRSVPSEALDQATIETLPDGRTLWRLVIESPDASGLRVHFSDFDVGQGKVWVYSYVAGDRDTQSHELFTGRGPFEDGEFWTDLILGEVLVIEFVRNSTEAHLNGVPFNVDFLGHLWSELAAEAIDDKGQDFNSRELLSACHLDVTCFPAQQTPANGVVLLEISKDTGGILRCTGSILTTRTNSQKPYLLTANHCISSPAEARSVMAYFFYQSTTCNGIPLPLSVLPRVVGGTYLAGAPVSGGDFAFVLLNADVPPGTSFLGWNAVPPPVGGTLIGIHHPDGSWKRVNSGFRLADSPATVPGVGTLPADKSIAVEWTLGITEHGSSGSPLLNTSGQVLGTLSAGPDALVACVLLPNSWYGHFATIYPAIRQWLEDEFTPSISVSPQTLTFTVRDGQYIGASQQGLTITTNSPAAIPYSISTSSSWVRFSRTSGNVSSSSPASIAVAIDPTAFNASTNAVATITVRSGSLQPTMATVRANVTITPVVVDSNVRLTALPDPVYMSTPDSEGYAWFFTIKLEEIAGTSTTLTNFRIGSSDFSSDIAGWFGTTALPANGNLEAGVRIGNVQVPRDDVIQVSGRDASGRTWTRQTTVRLRGAETSPPKITEVLNGASLQPGLSPGQWVTIRGINLSNTTRTLSPFLGRYRTTFDGLTVTINGVRAFLHYISPTQLNVISPDIVGTGVATIVVENGLGRSEGFAAFLQPVSPAAFLWPGNYVVATDTNYQWKIKDGTFLGTSTSPAKSGEVVILWTTGLGSTNPPVDAGRETPSDQLYSPTRPVRVFLGSAEAEVLGVALAPGLAALYQVAIRVPALSNGDYAVRIEVGGVNSPSGTLLTVLN